MFKTESDVRKFLAMTVKPYWIENKAGGTFGMPDCLVFVDRQPVFMELKVSEDGVNFSASPQQINILDSLMDEGVYSIVLAGVKGTDQLFGVEPQDCVRKTSGRRPLFMAENRFVIRAGGLEQALGWALKGWARKAV